MATGVIIGAAVIFAALHAPLVFENPKSSIIFGASSRIYLGPHVILKGIEIPVEIASSSMALQKGLSGRLSLDHDKGMLFLFSKPDYYRFWMPDMHFPLDIIWVDKTPKIAGIEKNISPEFDPANPRFYISPARVQYVLEVNAGFSENIGIEVGDKVIFKNFDGNY